MTDERTRMDLFHRLVEVLGPVHGDALMAHVPPPGWEWGSVATKEDLATARAEARADFETFRAEARADFETFRAEMRGEFETFRAEMRGEFETFRAEMRGEVNAVEQRLRTHMAESTRTIVLTVVLTVVFSLVGAILTTASLFLAFG